MDTVSRSSPPYPAVPAADGDAEQAQLRHLGHDLGGVLARPLHLAGHRLDLGVDELSQHVLEHLLLLVQLEVHLSAPPSRN